jgi:outer membrane receptor protein involved in Fe transport
MAQKQKKGTTMRHVNFIFKSCSAISLIIAVTFSSVVLGAESDESSASGANAILEEVTVTARKREESLQDVPIAITAFDGDFINEAYILDFEQLTAMVPNVTVGRNVAMTNIFIRGIGSGVNQGFEQSVPTFVDGIYMGRGYQARIPMVDVKQVSILKGPQTILFGKNTIGGALTVETARPTDEFEAYVDGYYGKYNEYIATGMVSGPLGENISGRMVVRAAGSDGWLTNTTAGTKDPETSSFIARGSLLWTPSDQTTVFAKYEHLEKILQTKTPIHGRTT